MRARTLVITLVALVLVPEGEMRAEWFREVGEAWGLQFRHHHGGSGRRYMVETLGGGVAMLDYDLDGDWDLFFVDSGALPGYEGEAGASRLMRNDGGGRFVDVTARAGIRPSGYPMGPQVGDIDGDGDPDLFITAFGADSLWRNEGDGTFVDVTESAGVGAQTWSASSAFGDADGDGDLDLYVTSYVGFTLKNHQECDQQGTPVYCHPTAYPGVADVYYRNRGDGEYEEATEETGLLPPRAYAGLGVVMADFTGDGWLDILVANDSQANFLFRNRGDGSFVESGLVSGISYGDSGRPEASMGIGVGDIDGDHRLDIAVTNFELETNVLYQNLGSGLFRDARYPAGVAEGSIFSLAFGTLLVDLDNDADLDLVTANGHVLDNAEIFHERSRSAQRNQLWQNTGEGRFSEVGDPGFEAVRVSRGLAAGDLDGDGDLDLVFVNNDGLVEVYENLAEDRWLLFDVGSARVEAPGAGARVRLESGGSTQSRSALGGGSYLARSAPSLHLGLGDPSSPGTVATTVRGVTRVHRGVPVNHRVRLPSD